MSDNLTEKKCVPCEGGTAPMTEEEVEKYLGQVSGWEHVSGENIEKEFSFPDFKQTLSFVNRVGELAEEEDHHPDISFGYGRATISLTTHAIGGLSENDFILAAKIDELGKK